MTITTSQGTCRLTVSKPEQTLDGLGPNDRVVIDQNVYEKWPSLSLNHESTFVVPPGEASKCLAVFGEIASWLAKSRANRKSRVFAVGGGVVGDLAGFVAASYMRGVGLVMIPTSLLAMVDSSVGGKVAIDIPEGKNLVGAFWQPTEIRVAIDFLKTLPAAEMLCGAAEVWKYGYIMDENLVIDLEANAIGSGANIEKIVTTCIAHKASVVQQDEHETTGLRAILNFGHTIGHAVEAAMSYAGWTHGEAISVGMAVESELGEKLGVTPPGVAARVSNGLKSQRLPTKIPDGLSTEALIEYCWRDKKSGPEGLGFSLLTGLGQCKLVSNVTEQALRTILTNT